MQSEQLNLIGTRNGATKQPPILNILHVPKTGGSSVWHTIADFSGVENPPIAYDFFHEARKDSLPFDPATELVHFLCVTGLLRSRHSEMHEWHHASHIRFLEFVRSVPADRRVLTHSHFPAAFGKLPEGIVTVSTTRESVPRFLSHAAHLLRFLRAYQDTVASGGSTADPLLDELREFPRDKTVVDFCGELAKLRPRIATLQLRYLLATLCSTDPAESYEIMVKWPNREVIKQFKRSFDIIRDKTTTIHLRENGRLSISDDTREAMRAFGLGDFQVNRTVLETVSTPPELRGKGRDIFEMFSADRSFRKSLAAENELLRELHGLPTFRSRVKHFLYGSGWAACKCA